MTRISLGGARRLLLVAAFVSMAVSVAAPMAASMAASGVAPSGSVAGSAGPTVGRLIAVEPCRLLDTRAQGEPIEPGGVVRVAAAGHCRIPDEATAVSITLTSIDAPSAGWLSVFPSGAPWPGTSTLNVSAGEVRANGSIVSVGTDGGLDVLVEAGGHVLVDVTAAFVPADRSGPGRFVDLGQRRVLDTRSGPRPAPGSSQRVPLPDGVPTDATALLVNLTITETRGPGHVTVHAAGVGPPETSVLNADGPGQTRAATAIVPASREGIEVLTSAGDHLIVDLGGYFTGPSADVASTGLFAPVSPTRLTDTRIDGPRLHRGGAREWPTADLVGGEAQAIVANLTMVDADAAGWIVAFPARTSLPEASSVNVDSRSVVANLAIVPLSTAGLAVQSSVGTHVVVDVTGWFTGVARTATGPPAENPVPDPGPGRTLIIGDSVAAAFRWAPSSLRHLAHLDHVLDVRTCRTTIGRSCAVAGGVRPPNTLDTIRSAGGGFDTVAVLTGYNDWNVGFASAIDQVMVAARAGGATEVVWFTLRTDSAVSNHGQINARLRDALDRHPDLRLADWSSSSAGQRAWFAADGVHLTAAGADALARFIARSLDP